MRESHLYIFHIKITAVYSFCRYSKTLLSSKEWYEMGVPFLLHKTVSSFKGTTNLCNWMRKLRYLTIYTVTVSWLTWTGRAPLYHFLGRSYGTGHRTCQMWSLQVLLHHSETKWISVFKKDIMYFIAVCATNIKPCA